MKIRCGLAPFDRALRVAFAVSAASALAACQEAGSLESARAYYPIPPATLALMQSKGANQYAPILIRTFKKESEFEVWKKGPDGRYVYIKTFPMCRWSGQLGPKRREGDRQVPEGFYEIAPGQMNPNSHYYLSFNVGYPNEYDRAHGDTGSDIMVHGICSSAGCFSMTNAQIAEIYAIAREAFAGGQREIQMESFPFHMTAKNLAKFRLDPNMPFWKQLEKGSDYFKVTGKPPQVGVCGGHYVFDAKPAAEKTLQPMQPCPALVQDPAVVAAVAQKERKDATQVAALVKSGVQAVRLVYQDGGQNPVFAGKDIPDESRPDALAHAPMEIAMGPTAAPAAAKIAKALAKAKKAPAPTTAEIAKAAATAPAGRQAAPQMVAAAAPPLTSVPKAANAPFYQHWLSFVSSRLSQNPTNGAAPMNQPQAQ